ncbi:MAG: PLDc N-terminal domain-containing protein [Candidatus Hydrogenedentes bacterium]|nr:PLDc N-terminal domain-containing protein [Candidatus Hydrogenedentota bacterium]
MTLNTHPTIELLLSHVSSLLGVGLGILLMARILRQQNRPAVSIAWLLSILLMPYVGVPAYLLFGGRKLRSQAGRKERLFEPDCDAPDSRTKNHIEQVLLTAGMPPARRDNYVEVIPDGVEAFNTLLRLIDEAQHSINIMTFILGRDDTGKAIIEHLARRAKEGVEVRLLLDALGCVRTRGRFANPLRAAGGKVGVFMPVLPLRRKWSANLRNHRKVAVFDQKRALIGGMNLAEEYMGSDPLDRRFIDTTALVLGPVVHDFATVFASDWEFATDEDLVLLPAEPITPENDPGDAIAQMVASGPDVVGDPLYEAILCAAYEARERIWITTPYFIPDEGLLQAVVLQTRLGRDVRIILPAHSNHYLADLARGRFLRKLHAAGAKIYVHEKMIHAKHILFDDRVTVVGTVNFDVRSLYLNYEIAMFVYSESEIARTEDWMQSLMNASTLYTPEKVSHARQWAEDLGLLVSPLL